MRVRVKKLVKNLQNLKTTFKIWLLEPSPTYTLSFYTHTPQLKTNCQHFQLNTTKSHHNQQIFWNFHIYFLLCLRMTQVRSIWAAYKIGFKTGCNTKVLKIVNILFMHDDLYFRELNAVFPFLLLSCYCVNFIVKYPLKIYKTFFCKQNNFFRKGKCWNF